MATIRKRNNAYEITVSVGFGNGEQKRRYKTWKPPSGLSEKQLQKELARVVTIFEEDSDKQREFDTETRFRDFSKRWIRDHAEKTLKTNTVDRYKIYLPRIVEALGDIKIIDLKPIHIISFMENLAEDGIRNDKKYVCKIDFEKVLKDRNLSRRRLAKIADISTATIFQIITKQNVASQTAEKICRALDLTLENSFSSSGRSILSPQTQLHHFRLISSILSTAVYWQLIPANPCLRVKPPRVPHKEANHLSDDEAKLMIRLLDSEKIEFRTFVLLLLYTGIRRGEACGLKWSDINFDEKSIHIERALSYSKTIGIFFDRPKTNFSVRTIKISDNVIDMLKLYLDWQNQYRAQLGEKWIDNDLVFSGWNGEPEQPCRSTARFRTFIEQTDLPQISLHSLRHTNASLLISAGIDVKTVSARLGHAKLSTTFDIYTHAIKTHNEKAANKLDEILM